MQWWCSAQGLAWSWTWRPYVGVWILVGLMVAGYGALRRPAATGEPGWRTGAFAAGILALWAALDWPLGALAAGYLASAHMLQFLLVGVAAPALLLIGLPRAAFNALAARPRTHAAVERLTRPLVAIAVFNVIVWLTHWPALVDRLMPSQLGSFAIDMLWFGGGVVFWWPVICPVPARPAFTDFLKIGYLILNTVASMAPYVFLTFSGMPLYATYELAPPIPGVSKREDQQMAGLLMQIGGGVLFWTAITILFFRWHAREEAGETMPRAKV